MSSDLFSCTNCYSFILKNSIEAERAEEQLRTIQKKMQSFEGQYDHCAESLFNANIKLEEREKVLVNAETDVGNLTRRIVLLEEEVR